MEPCDSLGSRLCGDIEDAAKSADCRSCPGRDSKHCCRHRGDAAASSAQPAQRHSPQPADPASRRRRRQRQPSLLPVALLALLAALLPGASGQTPSPAEVFLTQPSAEPYLRRVGDEAVELPCSAKGVYADRLQWLYVSSANRLPSIITRRGENNFPDHYELVTAGAKGTYNLVIRKVDFQRDNGNFFCQFQDPQSGTVTSGKAEVVVLVRPGAPRISEQTSAPLDEGASGFAECESEGGNPAPTIAWAFANGTAAPADLLTAREGNVGTGEPTVSRLRWPVSASDDGGSLVCSVHNAAMGPEEAEGLSVASRPFTVRYKPRVTLDVEGRLSVEEGAQVSVVCSAQGNPSSFRYSWTHSSAFGQPELSVQTERLTLSVERENAGTYTCTVSNDVGEGSASVELDVLFAPRLSVKEVVTVAQGSSAVLECEAEANPPASRLRWTGPDGVTVEDPVLELSDITKAMAGNYTCEAENVLPLSSGEERRNSKATSQLKVRYRPGRAIISVQEERVVLGSSVTLFCSATEPGEPAAEFRWKAPDQTDYMYNPQSSYTIQNVQLSNAGEYWCKPQNQLDENTVGEGIPGSYLLRVIQPAQLDQALPAQPLEVAANASAAPIFCEGRGNPVPTIAWLKDGEEITNEAGLSTVPDRWAVEATKQEDGCAEELRCSFRIRSQLRWVGSVAWDDKGHYTCRVSNGEPGAPESSLLVRVRHAPRIDSHSSRTQAAAELGDVAFVRCRTSANPQPSFRWTFQGQDIAEGGRYKFLQDLNTTTDVIVHTLRISGVSENDLGEYLCRASNRFGQDSQTMTLKKGGRPEPASDLAVIKAGPTWLRLAWQPGFDGGFPQSFGLELTPLNPINKKATGQPSTFLVPAPQLPQGRRLKRYVHDVFDTMVKYNVSDLLPGQNFYFRVRAKNTKGEAERWSEMKSAQTGEAQPDHSITKVTSAIYNAQDGTLSFKPTIRSTEFCVLVWLESAEKKDAWGTLGCMDASLERLDVTPGAANLRLQFRRKLDGAVGNSTLAMHATDVGVGGVPWGTVVPVVAVAGLLLLLALIGAICCCVRSRSSPAKKRPVANVRNDYEMETNGARPKAISGPFLTADGSLEKVPVEGGSSGANTGMSNGDSGVFTTLGSISQPYAYEPEGPPQGYHNGGYGQGPYGQGLPEDAWAQGASGDPYGADYGPDDYPQDYPDAYGQPGYYDPYGNPNGLVDHNPQGGGVGGGRGEEEGSVASGYSTPNQRRVMREIIV